MHVLITGGCGFIGSHLTDHCLAAGWKVTALDDLSTGSLQNVVHLAGHPNFRLVAEGTTSAGVVDELAGSCDFIFHLAAVVGVRLVVNRSVHSIENNLQGTEIVLRAAAHHRKPVLITSTSEVYGKSVDLPYREDADLLIGPPTCARWSYACGKALDEFLALGYWREQKLPVIVVRLFNTVGPRQSGEYGMVIPNFIRQALAGQPITVFGSGRQRRCFGYVGDVVKAIKALSQTPAAFGEIVNIGGTSEISIAELAQLVKHAAGSAAAIEYIPYHDAYGPSFQDMHRRVPAVDKLKRLIGFCPETPLESILFETIDWMRAVQQEPARSGLRAAAHVA